MVGPRRPQFVLFGSSVVQMSFNVGGWGAIFADLYARKVKRIQNTALFCVISQVFVCACGLLRSVFLMMNLCESCDVFWVFDEENGGFDVGFDHGNLDF